MIRRPFISCVIGSRHARFNVLRFFRVLSKVGVYRSVKNTDIEFGVNRFEIIGRVAGDRQRNGFDRASGQGVEADIDVEHVVSVSVLSV